MNRIVPPATIPGFAPVTTNIVGLGPIILRPLLPFSAYGSSLVFANGSLVVPNLPSYNVSIQVQNIIVTTGPNVPVGTTIQATLRISTNACNQTFITNTSPAVPVGTPFQFTGFGANLPLTAGSILSAELEFRLSNGGPIFNVQLANPLSGSFIIIGAE